MIKLLAALVLWAGLSSMSNAIQPSVPCEIIVKYRSSSRLADHGKVTRRLGNHWDVVKLDEVTHPESENSKLGRLWQKIRQIRLDTNVLYAEPNFQGHFEETLPAIPNDPSYSSQWWLPAVGDREMWALGRGAGVIVAVIDTGVDLTHPDLIPNLLSNGYNFGDGNANPQDVLGHGTKVAGIIAARQNDGIGVSGLAPEAKILPIKINSGGQRSFSSDQLASAIAYAVDHRAKIINLSLTVDQQTQTVQDAIQSALDKGVIVVAAAGNYGGAVEFPATMPGVFAVAATDQTRQLASFSNFGPEILVAAPGTNMLTTALGGGVTTPDPGTSFSAPVVSATITDMLSINPTLSVEMVSRQLRETASAIDGGKYTFGNLNAGAAGNSLVPHLQLSKQQFSAADSIAVNFSIPPTGTAVDVYVAVETPVGNYSLHPDGNWVSASQDGYQPITAAYRSENKVSGALFGNGAPFPPIYLNGLPTGSYTWAIAILTTSTGRLVGDVMTSSMQLR
ncbi:MAG: S8 family serine peptidase [Proteobacteria bacterium]|nr:S8 family serine peptidase [Pseudomonadota bacterium]